MGDEIFAAVPADYAARAGRWRLVVTDLARLLALRDLLRDFDRAIWFDADVLVFAPDRLAVDCSEGYAFSREVWVQRSPRRPDEMLTLPKVNNAACMPLPLIPRVALFSPPVLRDIAAGDGACLRAHTVAFGEPVCAANLGNSFLGKTYAGVTMDENLYEEAIDILLATGGAVLNKHLRPS
jgi:hypothetical protein